jgi:uncharacterized protein YjbI with pentapeptide repeats
MPRPARRPEVDRRGGGGNKASWEALVIVGALLVGAAAGFWFSEQRNAARLQAVEDELARLGREDDGVALRTYFEQMAQLLLDRDLLDKVLLGRVFLGPEEDGEVQKLARARTLTAIADSDAEDNRSLTRFLSDTDLVTGTDPVSLLRGAYLPNADLSGAFLPGADLYISKLGGADLSGAFLISADLGGSILSDADLEGANLRYADLDHTDLDGADLKDADLSQASLVGADLRGADLEGASVTQEQLDACESLQGATMPDGSKRP